VNIVTGKMEFWKTFGAEVAAAGGGVNGPIFSRDGTAYAYVYSRSLSQVYMVTGLR
jgi:hypothetical protein